MGMTPLGGMLFHGATLTERDDLAPGAGVVGQPVYGRGALLADLELRLGLAAPNAAHGVRLQQWSRRLAEVAEKGPRFYSASYSVDPIGTAGTLLTWRDGLVDAGWNGQAIPDGGPRLQAFAELERGEELLLGRSDRLRRVEDELAATGLRPWDALELAEPRAAWPGRWRRIFALLEGRGTTVRIAVPAFAGAAGDSDLSRLQASLRGEATARGFRGDGSLVLLTGETSWELAHGTAAALRHWHSGSTVVVRGGESLPLGSAMAQQGLARQGVDSQSAWRPALQLLPLALELAFTPRDPYRVLELVTLPLGPFAGWVGLQLARALSSAPGIGGRAWQDAKRAIAERLEEWALQDREKQEKSAVAAKTEGTERLEQIAQWLEEPGHDALRGAPRTALLQVTERAAAWLQKMLLRALAADAGAEVGHHDVLVLRAALAQARGFQAALSHDVREQLDLVAVRQLLEEVSAGPVSLSLASEEVGRLDVVDSPAGLRCSRELVVWWHCVNGTQSSPPPDPWRRQERKALGAAGLNLMDASAVLAAEVEGWRGVVLAATRRLVLVLPSTAQGERLAPHPIVDELVARVHAGSADVARVSLTAGELVACDSDLARRLPQIHARVLPRLTLPLARSRWDLAGAPLGGPTNYSPTSLEALLGCPLRWVFRHRAGLGSGWAVSIPSGPRLNGQLGHRLIEELHLMGALQEAELTADAAKPLLERLLQEEAAVLLRPGMTFELSQLRTQLVTAATRLAELIRESQLKVVGVEVKASASWAGRSLEGRMDLLLADAEGHDVILDLKWGRRGYQDKLARGLALQLAVYAGARQIERGVANLPTAAYFSLTRGELLTTERGPFGEVRTINGPKLADTWTKLERTVSAVERMLSAGQVPATGLSRSLPLLDSAGIEEAEHARHAHPEAPCEYCEFSSLCGRAWEHLS
jgi:RecB family exonuclease